MDLGLRGKTAVVTGASQGIGRAVATALAAEGCSLYVVARSLEKLNQLSDRLKHDFGLKIELIVADLGTADGIDEVIDRASTADILINNAGTIPAGRIDDIDRSTWRTSWNLKVYGYIDLCRAFFSAMKDRGEGVIVNIIGASGERPKANYICGATANAALMAFTQALGGDSMEHGVRVVGVNPGPVETERLIDLTQVSAAERLGDANRWRELFAALPNGRAATAEEIAYAVAFVASKRSSYTSGTFFTVDGGYCNRGSLM